MHGIKVLLEMLNSRPVSIGVGVQQGTRVIKGCGQRHAAENISIDVILAGLVHGVEAEFLDHEHPTGGLAHYGSVVVSSHLRG